MSKKPQIIVVYQPHQNIRQHFVKILEGYLHCFDKADKVYWLPTFLSRENDLPILSPQDILTRSGILGEKDFKNNQKKYLLTGLAFKPKKIKLEKLENKFEISELDEKLEKKLEIHKKNNDLIIFMGAGNIDNWAKKWLKNQKT